MEDALAPDMIARAKAALERCAAEDERHGVLMRGTAYDPDDQNIRIGNLPGRDPVFREMLELPIVKEIVTGWLGPNVRLSNFTSNTTYPGAGAMALHADQNNVPAPWPPYACCVNIAFALDDFTESNATRYIPDTHRSDGPPAWNDDHPEAVPLCGSAGSLLVMEGRLYHQTGCNTGDSSRAGAFAFFVRSFLAPQYEWHKGIAPALRADLTSWQSEIMGFGKVGGTAEFISNAQSPTDSGEH
ncbi:hypothetical protein BA059_20595 [Mycolicibacterium sp. (ex Dasyatis americana)]|nr:hypothetical protein BA059_20595 [Mycolicibacterium sp. (ex Dasyatis americana)]